MIDRFKVKLNPKHAERMEGGLVNKALYVIAVTPGEGMAADALVIAVDKASKRLYSIPASWCLFDGRYRPEELDDLNQAYQEKPKVLEEAKKA